MTFCAVHGSFETKATDIAVDELRRKLRLENAFKRDIRSVFRRMGADFRTAVASTGVPRGLDAYRAEWAGVLNVHYTRVQRAFRNEIERQNEKALRFWSGKQTPETDELIDLALLEWRENMDNRQADEIVATSEREMTQAVQRARSFLVEDGQATDNRTLAAAASAILITMFAARVNVIAQTETQSAAEATKQVAAQAIAGSTPFPLQGQVTDKPVFEGDARRDIKKTWDTVGDARVRPSHRAADGTTIGFNEAFVLEGARLRFPGDLLFGAPIGLWINCRCSARYEG